MRSVQTQEKNWTINTRDRKRQYGQTKDNLRRVTRIATWMHATIIIDWTEKGTKKSADAFRKFISLHLIRRKKKKREKIKIEREKRKRERKRESNVLDSLSKNKFLFYY